MTAAVALRREVFEDIRMTRLQESVAEALRSLNTTFANGVFVDLDAQSGAGVVRLAHKLGRVPQGFLVTKMTRASGTTTDVSVYMRQGETLTSTELDIYTTGAWDSCTVWVF